MTTGDRACQQCGRSFAIDAADCRFYAQIKVPPPTFCPLCRHVRRLAHSHSMRLYRRACNVPGHTERIVSKYPSASPFTVYDAEYWWSDDWDPLEFGAEYDFGKSFFEQLDELYRRVPLPASDVKNSINCDYCVTAQNSKDCYLMTGGFRAESCMYSDVPAFCKSVVDSYTCLGSDTLYECLYCDGSFNLKYSAFCEGCMDSAFLYDCKGCSDCFGCANLKNKKYCIFNVQYSKKEYFEKLKEMDISSRSGVRAQAEAFQEFRSRLPVRHAHLSKSVDCTGDVIGEGKGCRNCFEIRQGAENCRYVFCGGVGVKDSYDVFGGGLTSSLLYESKAAINSERVYFSNKIGSSMDAYYSFNCDGCSQVFACAGLRHKRFCVFNRQYTESEYHSLVERITAHMDAMPYVDPQGKRYGFGEFPPSRFSVLPYNESMAQVVYPLAKEDAERMGFWWQDQERHPFAITLHSNAIPDRIDDAAADATNETIECADKGSCTHGCVGAFRVIPQELAFYKATRTPLPDLCPTCRYARRIDRIRARITDPFQLERSCDCMGERSARGTYRNASLHAHGSGPCGKLFTTSLDPTGPEIVYCEKCYQAESS